MFMFKGDKDKLRDELSIINRRLQDMQGVLQYHFRLIQELEVATNGITNIYPHGSKKDGTPRAKPGRKPKGVQA
jgi:hypothetical protein